MKSWINVLIEFGPFRLDAQAGVVTRFGEPEPLGPRGVAVLAALLEKPHALVAKEAILKTAWPGLVVEESNLTVQISAIRRMLERVPGGERWLETIPRRGYRFTGPVKVARAADVSPARQPCHSTLPAPVNAFIGRERELAELKRLLSGARLLTLVGTGGIGKTRLALELAGCLNDSYPDGTYFADLAPLTDGAMVATAVARAFDLQAAGGEAPIDALVAFVKGRRLLLVMDNCEHLLEASARLAYAMLRVSAEPTIVATSREPLHAEGEQLYRLQTLRVPSPQSSREEVLATDAARLFIDRARLQDPYFAVDTATARVLATLCARLEGMPLALELAAAQAGSLSVGEIDARLADRLGSLAGASRTAPERQRSLRATLDWSYERLSSTDQRRWRQLAVFAGGCTREAALAVMDIGPGDSGVMERFVARSLVNAGRSEGGERFSLFDTVRDYAAERLEQAGEAQPARRRHAEYFLALAVKASDEWLAAAEVQWRSGYTPEIDNLRVALDWAMKPGGDQALAVRLAGAAGPWFRDLKEEGSAKLAGALAYIDAATDPVDEARLWFWLGALREAEPATALDYFQRAVPLLRRAGRPAELAFALIWCARAHASRGELDRASDALAEASPLVRVAGLPRLAGYFHDTESFVLLRRGDLKGAAASQDAAIAALREAGNEDAVLSSLVSLGNIAWTSGDLETAAASFREVVERRRTARVHRPRKFGFALANLAGVLTERGELPEAGDAMREAAAALAAADLLWIFADHFALHAALAGRPKSAARLAGWADAQHAARQAVRETNEARARGRTGELLIERFGGDQLEALRREGARLRPDEVCDIVLAASDVD